MKPLIIIGLLLISTIVKSQIYILIDPAVRRAGFMYNKQIGKRRAGIYSKLQYGIIKVPDFYSESIKAGAGASVKFNSSNFLFIGLNYNRFFNTRDESFEINLNRIQAVSIDIGISSGNEMRFKILFITDPINWETSLGFSYQFN